MLGRRRPLSQIGWGWQAQFEDLTGTELQLSDLQVPHGLRQRSKLASSGPPLPQLSRVFYRLPSLGDKSHRSDGSFSSFSSDEESLEVFSVLKARRFDTRQRFRMPVILLFCLVVCSVVFVGQLRPFRPYISEGAGSTTPFFRKPTSLSTPIMVGAPQHDVDALVFVSLGPKAISPAFTWSVRSAIESGGWEGPVYIITDDPTSTRKVFESSSSDYAHFSSSEKIRIIEPQESLIGFRSEDMLASVTRKARLTKCQLLKILPNDLRHVLYIDADIVVGGSMIPFLLGLDGLWREHKSTMPMALFQDCKAFTAGFSTDCDTWNTGVMSLRRGSSESCMDEWCETLIEQEGSDQAALDAVIAQGSCQGIQALDQSHLRMMKDVFVLLGFIESKTFNHFTQLFRPHKLQAIHRWFYERKLGRSLNVLLPTKFLEDPDTDSLSRVSNADSDSVSHEEDNL